VTSRVFIIILFQCPLNILEESSFDQFYIIWAVRGKNRWAACLQSSRPSFYCFIYVTVSDQNTTHAFYNLIHLYRGHTYIKNYILVLIWYRCQCREYWTGEVSADEWVPVFPVFPVFYWPLVLWKIYFVFIKMTYSSRYSFVACNSWYA